VSAKPAAGIAIVGCGFVADYYRQCLEWRRQGLRLTGVFDRDPEQLAAFGACWGDRTYRSLDALLGDPEVEIVVNLTSVESHAEVTAAAIGAGKHVYSEKPLAPTTAVASALRDAASRAGVRLAAAPCNVLGESAQTAWSAIRAGRIGRPMLVYAELDDGMVHRADYRRWISRAGRPWPARDEFATGCTFEHAGYAIGVLAAMFGPVKSVTAFSRVLIPDKATEPPLRDGAPDFSVGALEFGGGVAARVTNSIVAPYDHRLRIVGEEASIDIREPWDYASPVRLRRSARSRLGRALERRFGGGPATRIPLVRRPPFPRGRRAPKMDFARGVAELADAIAEGRRCRLDADFAVHVTEVAERLQHPERFAGAPRVLSTFAPIAPMDWAR
jgi:predicted dehydrogenase